MFREDRERYGGASVLHNHALRYLWVFRKCQASRNPVWRFLRRRMQLKYGLEIPPSATIGGGCYLGHAFNITVNPHARIGRNCNMHKGVTVGQENRGARKGAPIIGDRVWMGVNASVVGAVTIGDDVLIAPGAYVNQDIPSGSIVLGNPCKVIPSSDATRGYINQTA